MLGLLLALSATAHVPTYNDGCSSRCCIPPHHHTTSQVIYGAGNGGLELHLDSLDILGGEILDVDAVFKKAYNPTTYALYIGCGGCVPDVDPIVVDPVNIGGYQPGELEPFTGTSYRSIFRKEDRKFNTSLLKDCDQGHFTIRLVDYHNRTDNEPLIWGAVVGLAETFTFTELITFPTYVLLNHNEKWNELGWTVWVIFPLVFLDWMLFKWSWKKAGFKVVDPKTVPKGKKLRARLYDLAIVCFLAAGVEEFVHLCVAQADAEFGYQFFVALLGVILFANGFPILITMLSYQSLYYTRSCSASYWWTPVELLAAFSYLFLFGAGFYAGPTFVFAAGLVRTAELAGFVPQEPTSERGDAALLAPLFIAKLKTAAVERGGEDEEDEEGGGGGEATAARFIAKLQRAARASGGSGGSSNSSSSSSVTLPSLLLQR